ncbi:YopX family protein [Streptococcus uberis]|uniref:YopX family protein n=1 Tax=Streptococcus uberis TaxID=1349 RepID=UPI00193AA463|nr:YopX family protein [Streptococcus uberis]
MIPKFRAWGKNGNYPGTQSEKFEMFYDVSVVTTYQGKEQHVIADFGMYNESEYNGTEILDYQLMQSTGLFDKNGVEIFEGDVVNAYDTDRNEGRIYKTTNLIGIVTYRENAFCLKQGNVLTDLWVHSEEVEVIGNIYENPELIESVEE